jgi:hypothetical protein
MQECAKYQKEDTPKKEATRKKIDDTPNKHAAYESSKEKVKEVESSKYSCGDKLNPRDIRCTYAIKSSFDKDKDERKSHALEE